MNRQVLVIHGGDSFQTREEYLAFLRDFSIDDLAYFKRTGWKHNLQADLGEGFEVISPRMPNQFNARYEEWKLWFSKIVPLLQDEVILVGHSLGGTFLAKYLSEENVPTTILATFLVAACFGDNPPEYRLGDFALPESFELFSRQSKRIFLYHSRDDDMVPYGDLEQFVARLPGARVVTFEDRSHFTQEHFPEIVEELRALE